MKAIFVFSLVLLVLPVLADPTRPATSVTLANEASVSSPIGAPKLQIILQTEQGYQAMLNGSMVKVGDTFQQYRVHSINAEQVILRSDQGEMPLFIHNNNVKDNKKLHYEP
ncbi:hypothetical protein [Alishewanella tabrizica]|uniref:MSHA biogenesis protein MshK n=1 Tax=Alishewanella tabrizica TaxID=671278 RepID=A0ABQ2WFC0_9ALTE|nr:hypothetical protein [Alishewanella tabrizica]GGW48652.1 hypothetical protein GCM10008111_00400 [Alishewanella tabrizica]